ncbi:MAG: histidine phosphatase family protein [Acidobacteriota bacterium]
MSRNEIWLVRHGETAWSRSGQHTGWTDLDLLPEGEQQARGLGELLGKRPFAAVYSSPLKRAWRTCELAGYGVRAEREENLKDWNYGSLEGRTAKEMAASVPGWSVWREGPPDGERIEQVYARAGRAIERAEGAPGDVVLFAHGHLLRILACGYLGLGPQEARLLALSTASVSVLGWEKDQRVIRRWNVTREGR